MAANIKLNDKLSKFPQIPARELRKEILVVNSRFIAAISPAFSVEEAREFIERIHGDYRDASHHVPAFIIGHGQSIIEHCSDDGEPSGTAGRPALAVLKGSGLGDAVVVVTRYFGGTKLGTGGLVRAYTQSVQAVLEDLPRAVKAPTLTTMLVSPYSLYERIKILVGGHHGLIRDEDFGADVTISIQFLQDDYPDFRSELINLSNGAVEPEVIERNDHTLMPIR